MFNYISIEKIKADPNQPRQKFNISELKESIKNKGILVPVTLESNYFKESGIYLIIDGERRYRCAKELNLKEIPVQIVKGPLTFKERTILRFHIQEQHSNWSLFDKAKAIYDFKKETGMSITEIAEKLNSNPPRIHNWLSITELTEETQKEILLKNISFSYAIHLIKITKDYLSFSDLEQREIEKKLIQKINLNVFKTVLDFQKFSRLSSTYKHYKEKLEFLNNEKMSLKEIFEKTLLNREIDLEKFYKNLVNINQSISEIKDKKYSLEDIHIRILKEIKNNINELI